MPTCPIGHKTQQTDFCDTCGLPIDPNAEADAPTPTPVPVPVPAAAEPAPESGKTLECPNCRTPNLPQALFCEACGYDFETGQVPDNPWAPAAAAEEYLPEAPVGAEATAEQEPAATEREPVAGRPITWVAELWIDPDWYALQGSPDPLPSASLPDIIPLVEEQNLIGRMSVSRSIFPQIDCELDTGCSRRHALLTTDWTRWWVEDLDSANGTFVGDATGPLPSMPIPRGRVELRPDQRIYLGAWSRIVVRRATDDESQTLGA